MRAIIATFSFTMPKIFTCGAFLSVVFYVVSLYLNYIFCSWVNQEIPIDIFLRGIFSLRGYFAKKDSRNWWRFFCFFSHSISFRFAQRASEVLCHLFRRFDHGTDPGTAISMTVTTKPPRRFPVRPSWRMPMTKWPQTVEKVSQIFLFCNQGGNISDFFFKLCKFSNEKCKV